MFAGERSCKLYFANVGRKSKEVVAAQLPHKRRDVKPLSDQYDYDDYI